MLDVRYHIVYLCAVFLMLGFGMLIGEHLYLPAQVQQQARTLQELRQQVDGAVQDGRIAKARLEQLEQAVDVLRPRLVRGRLAGKRVDVIQLGDYPAATSAAVGALTDAGAEPGAVVTVQNRLLELSPQQKQSVADELAAARVGGPSGSARAPDADLMSRIAHIVLVGAPDGSPTAAQLGVFTADDLVTVDGDATGPCSGVVIVGGRNADDLPDPGLIAEAETDLIGQLAAQGGARIAIAGCEPLEAANSSVATYRKAGIATVDCIDQPVGQLALPFALFAEPDAYGLKPTAAHVLPPGLEEQTHP